MMPTTKRGMQRRRIMERIRAARQAKRLTHTDKRQPIALFRLTHEFKEAWKGIKP